MGGGVTFGREADLAEPVATWLRASGFDGRIEVLIRAYATTVTGGDCEMRRLRVPVSLQLGYPLEEIADAHRHVETGHKTGNVVITLDQTEPKPPKTYQPDSNWPKFGE